MTDQLPRIVVGTDGSSGARAAVTWAADEAALRRCRLVLAHAPHIDPRLLARLDRPLLRAVDEFAEVLLAEEAELVVERQPRVHVQTLLCQGAAAEALVNLSLDSLLVVVGSSGIGEATRSMLGSVSHRVAAHASCPVVVVPADGSSVLAGTRVVVGTSIGRSGEVALRAAADEAARRTAPLHLVTVASGSLQEAAEMVELAVKSVHARHPDLPVTSELDSGADASSALLSAAREADLLVLGCHQSADPWSSRLGPVVTSVLHRSPCPVMLVGPA